MSNIRESLLGVFNQINPDPSTNANPAMPFAVCTDVELGKVIERGHSETDITRTWARIGKSRSGASPKPLRPLPGAGQTVSVVEATSKLHLQEDHRDDANDGFFSFGGGKKKLIAGCAFDKVNLLAMAVHYSFYNHYPLRLGPDVIWLTIIQGLAMHIAKDPEGHRKHFGINFEGKEKLVVVRGDFVKGSSHNDWTTVFPEFANLIGRYVGEDKVSLLSNNFSTSTVTDQLCSQIALMDTVQHYFEYEMRAGCGIPSIDLTGTIEDWESLRSKAEILNEFGLEWWTKELFPVLDQFVDAASGQPNIKFWKNICNLYGASGSWSEYVTGWVQVLFPYLDSGSRNKSLSGWRSHFERGTGRELEDFNNGNGPDEDSYPVRGPDHVGSGIKLENIPSGISQAPVNYIDARTGAAYDYSFNGGIVAVVHDTKTRSLEPVCGWAVLDHTLQQSDDEL